MIEILILLSGLVPNFRTAHLCVPLLDIKYSINYFLTYCSCLFQIAYLMLFPFVPYLMLKVFY